MKIISAAQFSGWFSQMGQAGIVLQNVLNAIIPFVMTAIAGYLIYHLVKAALAKGKAESAGERKEAWARIGGLAFVVVLVVTGPSLLLFFMNTVGKTVQIKPTATGPSLDSKALILNVICQFKDNLRVYNLIN